MQKIFKRIFNRIVIFGLALIVQLIWSMVFIIRLSTYSAYVSAVLTLFSVIAVVWVINKDENPVYKLAWVVPILVAPLFGGLLYLMVGNKKPTRKMRRKMESVEKKTKGCFDRDISVLPQLEQENAYAAGQMRYTENELKYPAYAHTETKYYELGDTMFPDILEALKQAEHFIFMEYFIIGEGRMWGSILEILEQKAKEGVEVRLIYDDMGCVSLLPMGYDRYLERKGIKCMAFNPFVPIWSLAMNHRDHRKILVIDGHTAFSGGVNLADEYINEKVRFGHWKDTGFRLKGEAVWSYTVMFLRMWYAFRHEEEDYSSYRPKVYHPEPFMSDGYVQPYGDSPLDSEVAGENIYLNILNQARRYVYIFTPYLIIDNEMQTALCLAAKRGVDVRLVLPGIPDKKVIYQLSRSTYPPLLRGGVRIYEYTPGFLHAKSYVCDDEIAVAGTINMDYRSLYLHFECGTYFYKTSLVKHLKEDACRTMEQSREVHMSDTRQGFFGGLLCAVLRLFAPLL